MRIITKKAAAAITLAAASIMCGGAAAQQPYKIGISAGLTGYAATVDRAWTDGVRVAVDEIGRAHV